MTAKENLIRALQLQARATGGPLGGAALGAGLGTLGGPAAFATVPLGALGGAAIGSLPAGNDIINYLADKAGFAKPENDGERVTSAIGNAVASSLAGSGAASQIEKAPQYIKSLAQALSQRQGLQAVSSGAGSAAGEVARENDIGPAGQVAASLLAGGGTFGLGSGIPALVSKGKEVGEAVIGPLTKAGREKRIQKLLVDSATDRTKASEGLRNSPVFVPGSNPTTGQASADMGLQALEKGVRQADPNQLMASRLQEQNTARQQAFEKLSGQPIDIEKAISDRSKSTGPLYEASREELVDGTKLKPILSQIDEALEKVGTHTDAGKTLLGLKSQISGSMPSMKARATGLLDSTGSPISVPDVKNVTQGPLTQVYRESRDAAAKSAMEPGAYGSAVKGVVKPIIHDLGKAIESQSPSIQEANRRFSEMSRPIEQMKLLQEMRTGSSLPGTVEGFEGLSYPKLRNQIINRGDDIDQLLDPSQVSTLSNIEKDADRAFAANTNRQAPTGSDTIRNAMMGQRLGTLPGGGVVNSLVNTVYGGAQKKGLNELVGTMMDPNKSAGLIDSYQAPAPKMNVPGGITVPLVNSMMNGANPSQPDQPMMDLPEGAVLDALPEGAVIDPQGATLDALPEGAVLDEPQATNDIFSRIRQAESGGDDYAQAATSSATGPYQFTKGTWNDVVKKYGQQYGITEADRTNPEAQDIMVRHLAEDNANILKKSGIEPNDGDIYLAHFLGAPAAAKLIKNKDANVSGAQMFPAAAKANRAIFFDKSGKPRSVGEVYKKVTDKVMGA